MSTKQRRGRLWDPVKLNEAPPANATQQLIRNAHLELVQNEIVIRRALLGQLVDPKRDINQECGYPLEIDPYLYKRIFKRGGLGSRVVTVYPEESWKTAPEVVETQDQDDTEFESSWKELAKHFQIYHYLARADLLSGIGSFGVLLLGIDDGLPMDKPVAGIDERGFPDGSSPKHQLLFLRTFDETLVQISEYETDERNPRFGKPKKYIIRFQEIPQIGQPAVPITNRTVHWTRVIHLADGCQESEVFGTPRMEPVFDYLYNLTKIMGGSAEMFWKGGFPGLSFETNPNLPDIELDTAGIKKEMEDYSNGLQRYLALAGVSAKSLAPQVADPKAHFDVNLQAIAATLGTPTRILLGTEEAKLASGQDAVSWNTRVKRRRTDYINPRIIHPFVDRCIMLGILVEPQEKIVGKNGDTQWTYFVNWEDLGSPSDADRAAIGLSHTQAIAAYVAGGCDALVPPEQFFLKIMNLDQEDVDGIMEALPDYHASVSGDGEVDDAGNPKVTAAPSALKPPPPAPIIVTPPAGANGNPTVPNGKKPASSFARGGQ